MSRTEPRGYAPLHRSPANDAVLAAIEARALHEGSGSAILDLDGCIFDNRWRQIHILHELASLHDWPDLYRVEPHHIRDWHLANTLQRAGLDPQWVRDHLEALLDGWMERFFQSDYVLLDHPMPGAARLVRRLHELGLHICYLTGRHSPMRPGTERALLRAGFPLGVPRTGLHLKPRYEDEDVAFKVGFINALAPPPVIALDNEPINVISMAEAHPEALVVFVDTDHSPREAAAPEQMPRLRSFVRCG